MNALWLAVPCLPLLAACSSLEGVEAHGARSLHGRIGGRLVAEFDVGRSTSSHDVPSGVLTADVVRVVNDMRHRRVLAEIEFNNRSDDPLHIAIADVFLEIGDRRHGAKLAQDLEMPPLRPRTRQTVEFAFDLDDVAVAGAYRLLIENVYPFGRSFPITVRVPGLPPAPAGAPAAASARGA